MDLTNLIVIIDDILNLLQMNSLKMLTSWRKNPKGAGRKRNLYPSEAVTVFIWRFTLRAHNDWKSFWKFLKKYHQKDFQRPGSYESFIQQIHESAPLAIFILNLLLILNRADAGEQEIKLIDSIPIPVCHIKRGSSHKVSRLVSAFGKSTMGWFYGMKLHLVGGQGGDLLRVHITPGNVDDRKPLDVLLKGLKGIVIGDAGYVSKEWFEKLWVRGIYLFTVMRKNMKKIATKAQSLLIRKRGKIENVGSVIKFRMGLVTSLPRSISDYLLHYIYCLIGYRITRFEPKLHKP